MIRVSQSPKKCAECGDKFTQENSPDGVNGYEMRDVDEKKGTSNAREGCKKCYLIHYKERFPKEPAPRI